MAELEYPSELSSVVAAYLNTIQAIGDCMAQTCPEIGGPYHQRIGRLRARVAFSSTPKAVAGSVDAVKAELAGYALAASDYVHEQRRELWLAVRMLEQTMETLTGRVNFYGAKLRDCAARMDQPAVGASEASAQIQALRAAVEGMVHESDSLLAKMHRGVTEMNRRLDNTRHTEAVLWTAGSCVRRLKN
jgi:hypothetical protein